MSATEGQKQQQLAADLWCDVGWFNNQCLPMAAIAGPPGSSSWARCLLPHSGPHLRSQQLQQARILLLCNHVLPRIGGGGQRLWREAAAAGGTALDCRGGALSDQQRVSGLLNRPA